MTASNLILHSIMYQEFKYTLKKIDARKAIVVGVSGVTRSIYRVA